MTTIKRQCVRADTWDELDFESTRDRIPEVGALLDQMEDVAWSAPPLLQDVFQSLQQGYPRRQEVSPSYRVNQAVLAEIENAESFADLRQFTVGDATASGLSLLSMASSITEMHKRLGAAQAKADEAQAKRDAEAEAKAAGAADDVIDQLTAAAEAAEAELDEAIDQAVPGISKSMRDGLAEAAEDRAEEAEAAAGWGTSQGELARMSPDDRIALAKRLDSPWLRRVAAMFGRFRSESFAKRERRFDQLPEEIYDIGLGDDLEHLLPTEYAGLCIPELEDDLMMRLMERNVLEFRMRGRVKVAKGPIVYVSDGSDSMFWDNATRALFATSLGLSLLGIAKDEGRAFRAVVFGSAGQVKVFDWPEPASFTTVSMLEFAEFRFDGAGTDFVTGLDAGVEIIRSEFDAKGQTESDLVFCTDGEARVPDAWLAEFHAERERLSFDVFGVAVECSPTREPLASICNRGVARVADLATSGDVAHLFTSLT